jgi:hypothetical protein
MANNWMVRAGRGGIYNEDFEKGLLLLVGLALVNYLNIQPKII